MIGLLLIYYSGKYFYELAIAHNKNKFLYAFLGIVSYYGSMILYGIFYGIYLGFTDPIGLESLETNSTMLSFILLPFGILTAWLFYKFLEKKWSKKTNDTDFEVLDDVFLDKE